MPRDSIGRRVARAASIGGSRSYRSRTPYGWYGIVLAVCVIGLALIVFSRHEREQAASTTSTTTTTVPNTTPPTLTDHWQVALSVDVCGKVVNLPRSANQSSGIITTGTGVVDIWPLRAGTNAAEFEGANATLGKFLSAEGVNVTNTSLTLPSPLGKLAGTYDNGGKCGSKPGYLQVLIWTSPTAASPLPSATNAMALPYADGEMFMLAFVPKTTSVPRPLAREQVAAFLKSQTTTTTTSTSTTSTTIVGPTTTKPGSATTTTKPGSTTTTKPASTTSSTG